MFILRSLRLSSQPFFKCQSTYHSLTAPKTRTHMGAAKDVSWRIPISCEPAKVALPAGTMVPAPASLSERPFKDLREFKGCRV